MKTLDEIADEQQQLLGPHVSKLISDVARDTENLSSYQLDELEKMLYEQ